MSARLRLGALCTAAGADLRCVSAVSDAPASISRCTSRSSNPRACSARRQASSHENKNSSRPHMNELLGQCTGHIDRQ